MKKEEMRYKLLYVLEKATCKAYLQVITVLISENQELKSELTQYIAEEMEYSEEQPN